MKRSAVIWALFCCLLLVNGLMAAPSVSHAGHPEDHQATTHSPGRCAWFCAAAQGVESASVQLHPQLQPLEGTPVAASNSGFFRLLFTLASVDLLFPFYGRHVMLQLIAFRNDV